MKKEREKKETGKEANEVGQMYRQTDGRTRQIDRGPGRQGWTDRQMDRQINTMTDRQAGRPGWTD